MCWYVHPELSGSNDGTNGKTALTIQPEEETECKRCREKFKSKNHFMEHFISKHARNIVCRNWLKNNCDRPKCWYRHSQLSPQQQISPIQSVPNPQDFPQFLHPPLPPAQVQTKVRSAPQTPTKNQVDMQHMITQMAMSLNTMELQFRESRRQMHILQEMLAQANI